MRTHRLARFVAILLFLAAVVYFCGGMAVGLSLWSRGLGAGWGNGFSGWLAIPILAGTLFGALTLLIFGAIIYFLARIDTNLVAAQQKSSASSAESAAADVVIAGEAEPTAPPEAAPVIAEPIVVGAATAVAVADAGNAPGEPAVAEAVSPQTAIGPAETSTTAATVPVATAAAVEASPAQSENAPVSPDLEAELPADEDGAPQEFTGTLPGADEAARIASELVSDESASKPDAEK